MGIFPPQVGALFRLSGAKAKILGEQPLQDGILGFFWQWTLSNLTITRRNVCTTFEKEKTQLCLPAYITRGHTYTHRVPNIARPPCLWCFI